MKKGSLTVFFALIMVSVMTFTFTMAELVRINALSASAQCVTTSAMESSFSEYNGYLWDKYKILAVDLGYGTDTHGTNKFERRLLRFAANNGSPEKGVNFERLFARTAKVKTYGTLTDFNGNGAIYEGVKAAKSGLITAAIDDISAQNGNLILDEQNPDKKIASGKNAADSAKEENKKMREAAEANGTTLDENQYLEPTAVDDNPLTAYGKFKDAISKGMMSLLVADTDKISKAVMDTSKMPSHRELKSGSSKDEMEIGAADKVLYGQYLISCMNFYGQELNHDGLAYEVEYIVAGKESDMENISSVCNRILLIREGINCACITADASMQSEVTTMANALTGCNPALVPAVKSALIAVWAYAESVEEVRSLLSGNKVAAVKTKSNWNTNLWHLSNALSTSSKAAHVENGIGYATYLRGLLTLESFEKLGLRSCDIFEDALHTQTQYASTYTDNMLYKGEASISYIGKELFYSLFKPTGENINGYFITKKASLCY